MNFKEAIDYVYSFYNEATSKISLTMHDKEFRDPIHTHKLLEDYGVDIDREKNILVVGSKGKGTTATLLAEILTSQGYKVGLFTSPHLERFTERIKINGNEITQENLIKYIEGQVPYGEKIAQSIMPPYYLGPNGIFLAAALKYFQHNNTDFNVLESGRGGRYDDVYGLGDNIILTPMVLEHKHRLGSTLLEVVDTKHSVIDSQTKNVVVSKQSSPVTSALKSISENKKDYLYYDENHYLSNHVVKNGKSVFGIQMEQEEYIVELPTLAQYMGINLSSALAMAKILLGSINQAPLKNLANINFMGRCEIISSDPLVLLDGMICRESAQMVLEAIDKLEIKPQGNIAILAIPMDKDYKGVIDVLVDRFDHIIFTKSIGAQYPFPQDLSQLVGRYTNKFEFTDNLDTALDKTRKLDPGILGIFGTQSLIGEARKKIRK